MVEEQLIHKLHTMLNVPIERVEEGSGELVVYIKRGHIGRAIGSGGSVVRSAELVLGKKLVLKESQAI